MVLMSHFSTLQRRKTLERARARRLAIVHHKPQLPWWGPKLALLDSDVVIDSLERLIILELENEKKETH